VEFVGSRRTLPLAEIGKRTTRSVGHLPAVVDGLPAGRRRIDGK
jgi:hypothetical protein